MYKEYYKQIATYLNETFGPNFIVFTIILTTLTSIVYFILITYIITQMDTRYFLRKQITLNKISDDYVNSTANFTLINISINFLVKIAKIIAGLCLLVSGIIMLVLPGQGLITMVIGLSLLPFPGKSKIEQNILSRKSVRFSLNWIRSKAKKDPFIFE